MALLATSKAMFYNDLALLFLARKNGTGTILMELPDKAMRLYPAVLD